MWRIFGKTEKAAIAGGFLFSILWAFFIQFFGYGSEMGDLMFHINEAGPLTVAAVFGLYMVYRVTSQVKGRLGRALSVIGVGYILFSILSIPHAVWHGAGTNPGFIANMSVPGQEIIFHGGSAILFAYIAYGFYIAYKSAGAGEVEA